MSDTKTTTDDERLAWELACAEEEQPSAPFDEWSRKDRAKMLRIVAKARELLAPVAVALEPLRFADKVSAHADELRAKLTRRPAESGTVATRCTVYATPCSVHDFIHGAEAEELREGIEKLMENEDAVKVRQLRSLLDRVDARDSLAYLESHEAQHGERRTVAGERPAGCQRCNGTKIIPVDYDADGPCPDCKPPEAAPPEVATDALNKLLADTANGWRSGGALHIAFTEDIRANVRANIDEARTFVVNMRDNLEADDKRSPFYILSLVVEHLSRAMKEGGQ